MQEIKNIVEAGDYSERLLKEISSDINRLGTYTHNLSEELASIESKLGRARNLGLNVIAYEKQLLDFREIVLENTISMELEKQENDPTIFSDEIDAIEIEFQKLKELGIDNPYKFEKQINKLKHSSILSKIRNMIKNAKDQENVSKYSIDMIYSEIFKAKYMGVDVSEFEEELLS